MTTTKVTLLGAAAWAAVLISSAVVFKGQLLGDWIESALIVGFIMFLSVRAAQAARCKAESRDLP